MPRHHRHSDSFVGALGKTALVSGLAVVAGWIGYSRFVVDHHVPLPLPIDAEPIRFSGKDGRFLTAYADRSGAGKPLVLVHSINAAASAYELRPIFEHYRGKRPVYALDLPGFGLSERADRVYSPLVYRDAVLDLLRQQVGEPADVVALSLGSEFAALAALEAPDLIQSLTLISPSGFNRREDKGSSQGARENGTSSFFYRLLSFPLWSQAFYDLLATRRSIRWFLEKSFTGAPDEGLVQYDTTTAHQPGARYAPLYFVSGQLFTPDIREAVYERLNLPVLVLYDQDAYTRFDLLPQTLARNPLWRAVRIVPTRGLPQFERMTDVAEALDSFWLGVEVL